MYPRVIQEGREQTYGVGTSPDTCDKIIRELPCQFQELLPCFNADCQQDAGLLGNLQSKSLGEVSVQAAQFFSELGVIYKFEVGFFDFQKYFLQT